MTACCRDYGPLSRMSALVRMSALLCGSRHHCREPRRKGSGQLTGHALRSCQLRSLRSPAAIRRGGVAVSASSDVSSHERDSADLARFGYKQELKRSLGTFSSFAVAFSYISPSTGIFTLFALGLTTLGGVFIWTWPVVAARTVHHRAELRRGVQPLPAGRLGLPVDEVHGQPDATPGSPAGSTCSPASSP